MNTLMVDVSRVLSDGKAIELSKRNSCRVQVSAGDNECGAVSSIGCFGFFGWHGAYLRLMT